MSNRERHEQRDDMYALYMQSVDIDKGSVDQKTRKKLDRPHIFDCNNDILPASLIRKTSGVAGISQKNFRLGPAHSHLSDDDHEIHILEHMADPPKDLLKRFRRESARFRQSRKERTRISSTEDI